MPADRERSSSVETADVVVVGGRVAGCASAIPLARAGHRVVVLDRARFPSNVMSTHGLWPGGVAELQRLGALDRVLALNPPRMRRLQIHHLGWHLEARSRPVDGIDYMLCVGRPEFDTALQAAAREAGATLRTQVAAEAVIWDHGRAAGIRCRPGPEGDRTEIRASLVIGADGRRSTLAELVGSGSPYRGSCNGRGFAYWYMNDPKVGTPAREIVPLWRIGSTIVLVLAMPEGRMLVLAVCPTDDVEKYRRDPEGMWEQLLRQHRRLADRVAGATGASRLIATADLPSFFRASAGPGWALVGDAGHFKDPTLAQGMRDALEFGRKLGETAAPVLTDPHQLDVALRGWERDRDRACLAMYHASNRESRVEAEQPLFAESLRESASPERAADAFDFLSRTRSVTEVFPPRRALGWVAKALGRPGANRRKILRQFSEELQIDIDMRRERAADHFRSTRRCASERPDWEWPPARDASNAGRATTSESRDRAAAAATQSATAA